VVIEFSAGFLRLVLKRRGARRQARHKLVVSGALPRIGGKPGRISEHSENVDACVGGSSRIKKCKRVAPDY
jgi:hypothetical protein